MIFLYFVSGATFRCFSSLLLAIMRPLVFLYLCERKTCRMRTDLKGGSKNANQTLTKPDDLLIRRFFLSFIDSFLLIRKLIHRAGLFIVASVLFQEQTLLYLYICLFMTHQYLFISSYPRSVFPFSYNLSARKKGNVKTPLIKSKCLFVF